MGKTIWRWGCCTEATCCPVHTSLVSERTIYVADPLRARLARKAKRRGITLKAALIEGLERYIRRREVESAWAAQTLVDLPAGVAARLRDRERGRAARPLWGPGNLRLVGASARSWSPFGGGPAEDVASTFGSRPGSFNLPLLPLPDQPSSGAIPSRQESLIEGEMDPKGEAMARDAFGAFLHAAGIPKVRWRRGRERPDYYLRIGRASYAVEVTRIMDEHDVGGFAHSTHGVRASLRQLSQAVEREALRAGTLSGSYVMTLAPVPNLRRVRPELVAGALRYIDATRVVAVAPSIVLMPLPLGRKIAIQKVAASPNQVGAGMLIGPVKRTHVVQDDLRRLIRESLEGKRVRLCRTRLPRVLLLIDSFVYGELEDWRAALTQLDLAGFHTVARIADRGVCQVLYSEADAWSDRPTNRT
jgi:hypothetical protein